MEWVVQRWRGLAAGLALGVGSLSLDDLALTNDVIRSHN